MRSHKKCILVTIGGIFVLLILFYTISISAPPRFRDGMLSENTNNDAKAISDQARLFGRFQDEKISEPKEDVFNSIKHTRIGEAPINIVSHKRVEGSRHVSNRPIAPTRLDTFNFRECRMSNCFNFDRCRQSGPLRVHITSGWQDSPPQTNTTSGESNLIHRQILKIIRESKHFEPDPEKACIFVPEEDTLDRDPLSQSFRQRTTDSFGPNNQYGQNHLIFNLYSGTWPDYKEDDFAGLKFGAAILAKASNSINSHRPGFDISLPLFSHLHPISESTADTKLNQSVSEVGYDTNKTYHLTFKGKRYVLGIGSETRNSLYHLSNGKDVIMLTTCRHGKKWRESSDRRCADDESVYDQYDFVDLMRQSNFCLTPRGRRLGSFRFLEALSWGCVPVILSDGWVKPFDEIIDWSTSTVQFDENLILLVPDMLRDIDHLTISMMRRNCRFLYLKYFSTVEKIILTTLSIIERRIKNQHE